MEKTMKSVKEFLMKKPVILIVLILVLVSAAIFTWRHYRHRNEFTQAQLITHNGKRPLSKAELAIVNKQTQYFNTNTNHGHWGQD
jgi:cell division protein FtsL